MLNRKSNAAPAARLRRSFFSFLRIAVRDALPAVAFALAAFGATAQTAAPALPVGARQAADSITAAEIRAQVRFLSGDLLEGRGTGQRGGNIAAEYIATQFALDGLQPAGDNGTYLQRVPFVGIATVPARTSFQLVPQRGAAIVLRYGDDYVANNETATPRAEIDAPIVYVGHGIHAPEYQWDDFKGVDVRGKILLVLGNEPPSKDVKFFNGPALTYYGRWTYKYEEASRRGAIGVLIIHRTDLASYGWDVVRNSWSGEHAYLQNDPLATLQAASWIQTSVAQQLFRAAGLDPDKMIAAADTRGFRPVVLPVHLKATIVSQVRRFTSNNVVAMLPGADRASGAAAGRDQAVLYTAHYDHLGIDPSRKGDQIYNGAVDNGTGCGILLAIAHAYSRASVRPPHSVLFASVTAEEQGLLGSEYLGMHPPVPAGQITLDLNYDALLPVGIPQSTSVTGAERTTFYPVVEQTAQQFDLKIEPDSNPSAGHYYRSDHFSLARVGIPSFSIGEGVLFEGHPRSWGIAQDAEYTAKHYHQPSDEFNPQWDFSGLAKMARFGFVLGWKASELPQPIGWQPGDEFAAARQRSLQGQ